MDRDQAIDMLPEDYALAIRLHEAEREGDIPERLEIPPEAVGSLLRLARAKLTSLLDPTHSDAG